MKCSHNFMPRFRIDIALYKLVHAAVQGDKHNCQMFNDKKISFNIAVD